MTIHSCLRFHKLKHIKKCRIYLNIISFSTTLTPSGRTETFRSNKRINGIRKNVLQEKFAKENLLYSKVDARIRKKVNR